MKIIATISARYSKSYMVELTDDEIRQITGKETHHVVEVGDHFDVKEAYWLIHRHNESHAQLAGAARTLRALADLCEQQAPTLLVEGVPKPAQAAPVI